MMKQAPFIPTRDMVLFPGIITPIYIGRDMSMKTLEKALLGENEILLFLQKKSDRENPVIPKDIYEVGILVEIIQTVKMPEGAIKVLVEAKKRVKLLKVIEKKEFYLAEYEEIEAKKIEMKTLEALSRKIFSMFEKYAMATKKISPELILNLKGMTDLNKALDIVASNIKVSASKKQEILEIVDIEKQGYKLIEILNKEIEIVKIEKKINGKVKEKLNDTQKKYYLREKMKTIKAELGEEIELEEGLDDIKKKIKKGKFPKYAREKLEKEMKRLSQMPSHASEAFVIRNYIDLILDLPWMKASKDVLEIETAENILREDHYGLKEVKERIIEFLAVRKLNKRLKNDIKGTILCLVGPPGVGKTSLAKSIARATGRDFSRISLGGVRDEAEIRGHRRTYIGAMPGRILKELKRVNTNNPLILLDEIDKLNSDMKGDPTSALLEVLDPEQNREFNDNYLDMPFDLSKIFFIATANDLGAIPSPLRDRLEIITINSYTEFEKLNIAKKYLVGKSQKENGLEKHTISMSEKTLLTVINGYTREAGVRNLKREFDKIHRKIAKEVLKHDKEKFSVTTRNLKKYLGNIKFRPETMRKEKGKIGVVTGLAWTSVGGTTLEVQAVLMQGKGKLTLTGKLGDVMKESATVAYSYIRSEKEKFEIKKDFENKLDIHMHFPEGAVPKDGPSAGITITTALVSILTEKKVRTDIAMTGEITITGEVLAVGGIKEKAIGAHRLGIREVIIPFENESDIENLPREIKKDMKFFFVKNYCEVLELAFLKEDK